MKTNFKWLYQISEDNFRQSFDIARILTGSLYYPAAGTDGSPIAFCHALTDSFVFVDYSRPRQEIEMAMRNDFVPLGYRLIGLKEVAESELTPNGWSQHHFPLTESEMERMRFLHEAVRNVKPFALWAIYELDPKKTEGVPVRFSLLHICGDGAATFDALYVNHNISPAVIAIIQPAEGYGDNWTMFTNPEYRFFNLCRMVGLPEYLFLKRFKTDPPECPWPGYAEPIQKGASGTEAYDLFHKLYTD